MRKFTLNEKILAAFHFTDFQVFRLSGFRLPCVLVPLCLSVLVSLCLFIKPAHAVTFEATVDQTTVPLGSFVQLTVTATEVGSLEPIDLSSLDGFRTRYLGPSTKVSVVNGQYSSAYSLLYNLYPIRTGEFTIPGFSTTINGKTFSTDSITIKVVDRAASENPVKEDDSVSLEDRVFVVLSLGKKDAYVYEKVPVTVQLFVGGLTVRNINFPQIPSKNCVVGEVGQPQQFQKVIHGVRYTIFQFQTYVFPTEIGDIELGPVRQGCQVVFKDDRKRSRNGFFGDEFFDGFFNSYKSEPIIVSSDVAELHVKPLPETGKPLNFSGAVGDFDMQVSISPETVSVGDPVTVKVVLSGEGDISSIDLPFYNESSQFKVYDAQSRMEGNDKVLEQVIVPKSIDVKKIPSLELSYFDPSAESYKHLEKGPFALTVNPLDSAQQFKVMGADAAVSRQHEDIVGADIAFIKKDIGKTYPFHYSFLHNSFFWPIVIVLSLIWILVWGIISFIFRLKSDARLAQKLKAPGYARKGLKDAAVFLEDGKASEFCDVIFSALIKYFSHKCHLPAGAVHYKEVSQVLRSHGAEDAMCEKLRFVFEQCEAARYAAATLTEDRLREMYKTVETVIDWSERYVR